MSIRPMNVVRPYVVILVSVKSFEWRIMQCILPVGESGCWVECGSRDEVVGQILKTLYIRQIHIRQLLEERDRSSCILTGAWERALKLLGLGFSLANVFLEIPPVVWPACSPCDRWVPWKSRPCRLS